MSTNYKRWQKLFLFGLGLFAGTTFCMKWMEGDLWQNGQQFTIIGLEMSYSKEKVTAILAGLDGHVKTILRYHLSFDFAFMAGVYPGIAALCMMAREKATGLAIKKVLLVVASLQLLAWALDITENCFLLKWINNPVIGTEFGMYHLMVFAKWIIALAGVLLAVPVVTRKRKRV